MSKRFMLSYTRLLEEVREAISFSGMTITEIAEKMNMNRVSLSRKLNDNGGRLYAEELFEIACIVGREDLVWF